MIRDSRNNVPANKPSGVPAWMASLREAAFNAIKEDDIKAIVQKQVEKAKEGDPQAVKLVFDLFLKGGPQSVTQNNLIIEADVPPEEPTRAIRGSRDKVQVMAERARSGKALFHNKDA